MTCRLSLKTFTLSIAISIGSLGSLAAHAQQPASGAMAGMSMSKDTSTGKSPSTDAFMTGRQNMMQHMDVPLSGDTDKDFIAGMIPHHQGAIEMSKIELKYGKDPQARKMAQNIIATQEKEISEMHRWQAKHGAK
jgi:uncharacterized protein (DUF305 family)